MKIILVDDEALALEVLENKLLDYKGLELVASYTNPFEALEKVREEEIDVIFLDIEMGAVNGIEMAELFIKARPKIEIVFVTAYSQYAVEAFEINALDYLLKPIQDKRLIKAIKRLEENIRDGKEKAPEAPESYLEVNSFGKFEVMLKDKEPISWRTQKAKELFAYLWIQEERPVSKSVIMETLFPDRSLEKAITILHTTVYQIRKALKDAGFPNCVIYQNDSYQLNLPIRSDFKRLIEILNQEKLGDDEIEEILEIYKGDFLQDEGYYWAIDMQQKYKDIVFNTIEAYVGKKLREKDIRPDLKPPIETLLAIDPFRECGARHMMEYYGLKNMQSYLKSFYEDYKERLWEEMKLEPMASTKNMYLKYMEKEVATNKAI